MTAGAKNSRRRWVCGSSCRTPGHDELVDVHGGGTVRDVENPARLRDVSRV
jgi:hypothetical protein